MAFSEILTISKILFVYVYSIRFCVTDCKRNHIFESNYNNKN